jgi:hypothetical protein
MYANTEWKCYVKTNTNTLPLQLGPNILIYFHKHPTISLGDETRFMLSNMDNFPNSATLFSPKIKQNFEAKQVQNVWF